MSNILINFTAYIPKSLGKPLLSYFKNNPVFKPELMPNYYEFKSKLEAIDREGYYWLPEPGNFVTSNYFATDKVDFHKLHTDEHTGRLSVALSIDSDKIGRYAVFETSSIFKHQQHNDSNNSNQHSDESHKVQAYIKTNLRHDEFYARDSLSIVDTKFEGICSPMFSKRSKERPLKTRLENKVSGLYFTMPGKSVNNDTTVLEVSASAGYPFLETFSPNIDFSLQVALYLNRKTVEITIDGEHNDFPAYELLIENQSIYNYNPSDYGYTGPTPYNLGYATRKFGSKFYKQLSELGTNKSTEKNKRHFGL